MEKWFMIPVRSFPSFQKSLKEFFSNLINSCLSKHLHCLVLFVDFRKAFDLLTHSKLLQMLGRIAVRGSSLNWFKNYLDCRTYRVKICDKNSEEVSIDCGVPQGSKLEPILYLIYAN